METASSTVPSIVVYVTVPNKEAGKKLSESTSRKGLQHASILCQVQTDSEELLIIKTREALLAALTQDVRANHEYEVPEVVAFPINGGNLKYLEGLKDNSREK